MRALAVTTRDYLSNLITHLSYLYAFAKQVNELDFAVSLNGEFRGMQDAGWSTAITAYEVFEELSSYAQRRNSCPRQTAIEA